MGANHRGSGAAGIQSWPGSLEDAGLGPNSRYEVRPCGPLGSGQGGATGSHQLLHPGRAPGWLALKLLTQEQRGPTL